MKLKSGMKKRKNGEGGEAAELRDLLRRDEEEDVLELAACLRAHLRGVGVRTLVEGGGEEAGEAGEGEADGGDGAPEDKGFGGNVQHGRFLVQCPRISRRTSRCWAGSKSAASRWRPRLFRCS